MMRFGALVTSLTKTPLKQADTIATVGALPQPRSSIRASVAGVKTNLLARSSLSSTPLRPPCEVMKNKQPSPAFAGAAASVSDIAAAVANGKAGRVNIGSEVKRLIGVSP